MSAIPSSDLFLPWRQSRNTKGKARKARGASPRHAAIAGDDLKPIPTRRTTIAE